MEKIHLFLASDDNYAQHSGVVIASILYNHKKDGSPIVLHYLYSGVSKDSKEKLKKIVAGYANAEIIFHDMGEQFSDLKVKRHITRAAYYRLIIDKLVPSDVKKALYLDADVLVLGDIEELWNVDITDYAIGAVEDAGLRDIIKELKNKLRMPCNAKYFNSGVLLMNLSYWREHSIGEKMLVFFQTCSPDLPHHDQDALNSVLWNETLFIDPKWNVHKEVFHHYFLPDRDKRLTKEFINAVRHPAIVHFTGKIKPWHYACGIPYAEHYFTYVDMTPWTGFRPNDKTLKGFKKKIGWKIKEIIFK
ncbi:MAG: glycosyltransferase family 8 protein [Acidaminococcaceae bacterium]